MFSFLKSRKPLTSEFISRHVSEWAGQDFMVDDIKVANNNQVIVVLRLMRQDPHAEQKRLAIESKIVQLAGVKKAMVVLTAEKKLAPVSPPSSSKQSQPIEGLPPVVLAVASGKGGVGKSTVAVNLAVALSCMGKKVGILDADIYGPSLPRLLGVSNAKAEQGEDGRLQPISVHGLKAMSMGFLVDEKTAMIWRGPMAQSALLQMLRDVDWNGLDILVIDMPPGTGDIHLTLAQRVPLSGGVVVSTPQDIALIDARKGLEMFRKVAVPILGIVENMSYYACPECGYHDDIFGHGGARAEAVALGIPFLGEIPLHGLIRSMSDAGTPVTLSATESEQALAFQNIATQAMLNLGAAQRPAPIITMED